jgi:hypothetical protein
LQCSENAVVVPIGFGLAFFAGVFLGAGGSVTSIVASCVVTGGCWKISRVTSGINPLGRWPSVVMAVSFIEVPS